MADTTRKSALLAAVVVLLGVGAAAFIVAKSSPTDRKRPGTHAATASTASRDAEHRERDRVRDVGADRAVEEDAGGTAEEAAPPARITVRLPDRRPAADAVVVVDASGASPLSIRTDERGVATTPAVDRVRSVVVGVLGHPPWAGMLPAGAEGVTADLPRGAELGGLVRLDGRAPGKPIRMRLSRKSPASPGIAWTQPVLDLLREHGFGTHALPFTCDPSGAFRCHGLVAGERVWLTEPDGYVMDGEDAGGLHVVIPDMTVFIELHTLPRVRGRVVDDSGRPVPGAMLALRWDTGPAGGSTRRYAGDDGRFDFPVPVADVRSMTLRISDPLTDAAQVHDVPPTGADLGDLALPGNRTVRLRIVDPVGAPVVGAVVRTHGAAERSDADGQVGVVVPRGAAVVSVAAAAFHPLEHEIPSDAAEPHTVTLRPGTRLTMSITGADEALLGRLRVLLASKGARMFDLGLPASERLADGASESGAARESNFDDGTFSTSVSYDGSGGTVVVDAIRPDIPITMTLVDDLGYVHARHEIRLPAAQRTTVELPAAAGGRPFTLRVVDAAGERVNGARVSVEADPAGAGPLFQAVVVRAGPDRDFVLPVVHAPALKVLVRAEGYVPWSGRGVESGTTVRLVKGRSVVVKLRDSFGEPVQAWSVRADLETDWSGHLALWAADEETVGEYRLTGLPDRDSIQIVVTVETPAGDERHRFELDPEEPVHELTLGEPESIDGDASEAD